MKPAVGSIIFALLLCAAPISKAQSIATLTLGPNQIGQVKTTQGITTRIIFPEVVRDIVCGDLYDPATGKGSFVVQRIDNDVFLKPVVPKGLSNLFVKTGDKGEHTFGFDLQIVALEQGNRVVNVSSAAGISVQTAAQGSDSGDEPKKSLAAAQIQADEITRNARQQADRTIARANQQASDIYGKAVSRAEELDKNSAERAQKQVEDRFVRAMIQGVKEIKSVDSHIAAKKISVVIDSRVLTFDDKSYLRFTIKNGGEKDFSFAALSLERRSGKEAFIIPSRVIQGRAENKLGPGETLMGIIVFDTKDVGIEDRLSLSVRGEDNTEIARLNIQ